MALLNAVFSNDVFFAFALSFMAIISLTRLRDLSTIGAVSTGLSLIGLAAWITYHMQIQWFPFAEGLVGSAAPKKLQLKLDQVKEFESHVNFFLWLLPFVTASFGTNILSDALLRGFTYQDDWIVKRIVCDVLSGERILGSRKHVRISFEVRKDISQNARRDLQRLLAELPQFATVGAMGHVISMVDGSVVMPYLPRSDGDIFDCKLMVSWQKEQAPVEIDAQKYLALQLQVASTWGCNAAQYRRRADEIFREIMGHQ
jgi:hypothetical protein